ncbi:uncharacterized protein LOC116286471 [Actinia tenebrosa]|uniref:Uncharacterized protein LOC116286471 n=1 Tax=Actinia tenebrosa TaxID=6105 RepID=A0A6P8GZB6_ACTTE|nr:uncharacterized protein LOC116286471 [Actinia tenebrosa]
MAQSMRLITTIRGTEVRNRSIKCCVRESANNLPKKRGYNNHTISVDISLFVDPVLAAILWKLFNQSKFFLMNFTIWLYKQWKVEEKIVDTSGSKIVYNNYLSLHILNVNANTVHTCTCLKTNAYIHVMPLKFLNMTADIRWSEKLWPLLVEFAHLNDIMSWLSTLGGAYSSLGENCVISSKKAGDISKQQYVIASKLKNPILTAQCNLFLAMSLVQRGHLKSASVIIRRQYAEAVSDGLYDQKLISLCKAAWNKVRFKKQLKLQARHSRESIPPDTINHQDYS